MECQTFVKEHKLLRRSSDIKKRVITEDRENTPEINSEIKVELILRKNLDIESSQIININMAENNEEIRAFTKGEKIKSNSSMIGPQEKTYGDFNQDQP